MPTANDRGNARKMILKTPRLILRPFAANDLDCMAELKWTAARRRGCRRAQHVEYEGTV